MKFDKLCKIHEAAAKDASRYAIADLLFERDDKGARLVATDGRMLAVVPVTDAEGDQPGLVSKAAVVEATKGRTKAKPDADLRLPDDKRELVLMKHGGLTELPRTQNDQVFPKYTEVCKEPEDGLTVTFSAELLVRMVKAIGALGVEDLDGVTFKFHATTEGKGKERKVTGIDANMPVKVEPIAGSNESFGFLMPINAE